MLGYSLCRVNNTNGLHKTRINVTKNDHCFSHINVIIIEILRQKYYCEYFQIVRFKGPSKQYYNVGSILCLSMLLFFTSFAKNSMYFFL